MDRAAEFRAFSVLMESEPGSNLLFDALSLREPVSTSLENALLNADDLGIDQRVDLGVAKFELAQYFP